MAQKRRIALGANSIDVETALESEMTGDYSTTQRLYVDEDLVAGRQIEPAHGQTNYLLNVLRLKTGDPVLIFNGRDGEWRADIKMKGRKRASLEVVEQTRMQPSPYDLVYMFAPLKQARMEYAVQKAVEMGAGTLQPVLTHHTQMRKVRSEKLQAYAIEAAEQSRILSVPKVIAPQSFYQALDGFDPTRHLIFCDEGEEQRNPISVLEKLKPRRFGLLIGPEGGFSQSEREHLLTLPFVTPLSLGPRVLRADTAAVAALALIQATLGDWNN